MRKPLIFESGDEMKKNLLGLTLALAIAIPSFAQKVCIHSPIGEDLPAIDQVEYSVWKVSETLPTNYKIQWHKWTTGESSAWYGATGNNPTTGTYVVWCNQVR